MFSNDYLFDNQYVFFLIQAITMMPYLLFRVKYIYQLLTPSFFILTYYTFSFALGAYFVPRGFGFITKDFYISDLVEVQHFQIIILFLLLANVVLFTLTDIALSRKTTKTNLFAQTVL